MLFKATALVAVLASSANAFVPSTSFTASVPSSKVVGSSRHSLNMVDPTYAMHELPQHIDSLQHAFSSLLLSEEQISVAADALSSVTSSSSSALDIVTAVSSPPDDVVISAVSNAATAVSDPAVVDAAVDAAKNDNGWIGFLTGPIEAFLELIHSAFVSVGMSSNAWGISIIVLTLIIKVVTYPLTKTQLESTVKMQTLQPIVKDIQAKYASNPEVMNQKISETYQNNQVNPLAGCFPAIIQLPVFIGLYRAVLSLAKENLLDEPFLFLPSLEGPTYGADPSAANAWITSGWTNGAPSLGWADTIAYLSIPVFLIISQSISTQLMQPKNPTPEQAEQANNPVLKFLPFLIGFFSLGVPSALGIYWVANNIITTALTVQIRSSLEANPPAAPVTGGGATVMEPTKTTFTPAALREKPAGFSSSAADNDGITPITAIDAEVVVEGDDASSGIGAPPPKPKSKKRGKKKGKN